MVKSLKIKFLLLIMFILFCSWVVFPINEKINLGLDLQGGIFLTLRVDMDKLSDKITDDVRRGVVERTIEIIRKRIDQFGVKEPSITSQGKDRIVVQLPGVTDRQRAIDLIGRTAQLEFKLVSDDSDKLEEALAGDIPAGYELKYDDENNPLLIETTAVMSGESLSDALIGRGQFGMPNVRLTFTGKGSKMFSNITGANVDRRLAIILDEEVYSAPVIRERISGGNAEISGNFSLDEAKDLANVLKAGALPAPIIIEEERTVGPQLGADSIKYGINSTLIGGICVFIFMAAYYFIGGMIANVALILNILIVLAALVILKATLTLPGIAGIGLTLGMAVDANVLINERIREELKLGKSLRTAIVNGYSRAFPAILDSNITTIIASVLLVWLGSGPIKGFGTTLIIGLVASMFTAIFVTRMFFDALTLKFKKLSLKMLQLVPETKIDYIKIRKFFYTFSIVLIGIGLLVFNGRGDKNFGIDFNGGSIQEFKFENQIEMDTLRTVIAEIGISDALIQQDSKHPEIVLIKTEKNCADKLSAEFKNRFPENKAEIMSVASVGPVVGELLKKNAAIALSLALLSICIYIWFRFRDFAYGIAGIVAIFHDVLVCIAFCAITNRPIDLLIVTALMTVAGYSINDTIVNYDRIRENLRLRRRRTKFKDVINMSINQNLGRTIWTSVTTIAIVGAVFFYGGGVLHNFAFVLLVGFVCGVYSTVFIASPLVYVLDKK